MAIELSLTRREFLCAPGAPALLAQTGSSTYTTSTWNGVS
jgi:hypothetical protein